MQRLTEHDAGFHKSTSPPHHLTATQVFPSYELLGWYAVGNGPLTATDVAIHEAVAELNASPVFLHLQPDVAAGVLTAQF